METQILDGRTRRTKKARKGEKGKYFKFSTPQKALGFPVNGMKICSGIELSFSGGVLLSEDANKGLVFFRGNPDDDPRDLEDSDRECFFTITAMDLKRITFVN